jgi:hypothetical protein
MHRTILLSHICIFAHPPDRYQPILLATSSNPKEAVIPTTTGITANQASVIRGNFGLGVAETLKTALEATTGIEPV